MNDRLENIIICVFCVMPYGERRFLCLYLAAAAAALLPYSLKCDEHTGK